MPDRDIVQKVILSACVLLAACSSPAPPQEQQVAKPDHDLVEAIRAAGDHTGSAVEVHPLRDPAIDGFLRRAESLIQQRAYKPAVEPLEQALKLAPQAPDVMQIKAELLVGLKQFAEAEALARQSYELGPRLGSLCARNWQTVIEVRRLASDDASVASAKAQQESCRIAPRLRM
ncbi:MAG: tetratricopeptide repeat protein [Tahibacter sp.]